MTEKPPPTPSVTVWEVLAWIGAAIVALALIALAAWGIGNGFTAPDSHTWTPIDSTNRCYVLETDHRNGWLTPGHTWTTRHTYCRQEVTP